VLLDEATPDPCKILRPFTWTLLTKGEGRIGTCEVLYGGELPGSGFAAGGGAEVGRGGEKERDFCRLDM